MTATPNYKTSCYVAWCNMLSRCSPAHAQRANYFDKGIVVSEEWLIFENFKRDMGAPPPGRSLDRIDNNKGYSKDNCRWATTGEQIANRSPRTFITYKLVGVRYVAKRDNWLVVINSKYLGTRETLLEAAALRKSAENQLR